jgi:hypothetical protein
VGGITEEKRKKEKGENRDQHRKRFIKFLIIYEYIVQNCNNWDLKYNKHSSQIIHKNENEM